MLEIQDLNIWISPPDKNYIFWKYKPSGDKLTDFNITIERSINSISSDDFIPLKTLPAVENIFTDSPVNHFNQNIYYYRIKIFNVNDASIFSISEPSFFQLFQDREVLTIIDNELMYLKKYVRRPLFLYKVKKEGPRCECYDEYRQTQKYSECHVCFGIGFWGGYYGPFEIFAQIRPQSRINQRTDAENIHMDQLIGWTISSPQITPGDLLVDLPLGNIYLVQAVQLTEWHQIPVKQTIQLLRPDRSHPGYLLLRTIDYAGRIKHTINS
ncbi:MAG: hypothetical protein QXP66_00910 [Candidatus Aenigmatarchaeota archaeon]